MDIFTTSYNSWIFPPQTSAKSPGNEPHVMLCGIRLKTLRLMWPTDQKPSYSTSPLGDCNSKGSKWGNTWKPKIKAPWSDMGNHRLVTWKPTQVLINTSIYQVLPWRCVFRPFFWGVLQGLSWAKAWVSGNFICGTSSVLPLRPLAHPWVPQSSPRRWWVRHHRLSLVARLRVPGKSGVLRGKNKKFKIEPIYIYIYK